MVKGTMLIVDDEIINRIILNELFQDTFMILEAENGEEALEIVESCREHIDVVLLDLLMPRMNGLEVLKRRQSMDYFAAIPVVIITSDENIDNQVIAFEYGANDYITKPFIPEIVISRVNNCLQAAKRLTSIMQERQKLMIKSEVDGMTGLLNKTTVEHKIDGILQLEHKNLHAMMVMDIDNFKFVNDSEGHAVGDHTIKIVADLVAAHFRKTDLVGRIGGDEFVVLMANIVDKDIARVKANELVKLLHYKPNLTLPANISLSIGLAFNDKLPSDYNTLFNMADEALYKAKNSGKGRYSEHGHLITQPAEAGDGRHLVAVVSRDRGICKCIDGISGNIVRILECATVEQLVARMKDLDIPLKLAFISIDGAKDNGASIWNNVRQADELKDIPKIAICQEGSMEQYKQAIIAGTDDILSVPLDLDAIKRKYEKYL